MRTRRKHSVIQISVNGISLSGLYLRNKLSQHAYSVHDQTLATAVLPSEQTTHFKRYSAYADEVTLHWNDQCK